MEESLKQASLVSVPHNMTIQCKRLTDHVTINFNNNISTAAVFLDTEKSLLPCGIKVWYHTATWIIM
jgi:hypothetical protein